MKTIDKILVWIKNKCESKLKARAPKPINFDEKLLGVIEVSEVLGGGLNSEANDDYNVVHEVSTPGLYHNDKLIINFGNPHYMIKSLMFKNIFDE